MKIVLQLLFHLLCYAFPLLCVYIAMKIEIYGNIPENSKKEDKDIKKTYKKIAFGVCILICAGRFTSGFFIPLDYFVIYLWLFWSLYKMSRKGYDEGFIEGYNCAKEELENEYRKKLQEEVMNKW